MSASQQEDIEYKTVEQFLKEEKVQEFLDRERIDPSEVKWFVEAFIKEPWHDRDSSEAIGIVSLMYLTGVKVRTANNWWGESRSQAVLNQLGYSSDDDFSWFTMHQYLRTHGRFTKGILNQVGQYHALAPDDVDQRVILAAAEIEERDIQAKEKQVKRICDAYDTTFTRVNEFFEEYRGDDE